MSEWILLISPLESQTNEWLLLKFNSVSAVKDEIKKRDLTKSHYIFPVDDLPGILEKYIDEHDQI